MSSKIDNMKEKIEYLGLDLENIPSTIKNFKSIKYRIPKFYDEKQYKQYRYVSIKNIQILLSPTNRLDDIQDKYKQASPLIDYLDNKNEDNFIKHTTFLNMLRKVKIEDIENKLKKENGNIKIVSVTGASNVTGYINPIHEIARLAHKYGAIIVVDGAQLVAHKEVDMKGKDPSEQIDFLVFSAHKTYAPFGSGVIVGLIKYLDVKEPFVKGGGCVDYVFDDNVIWSEPPSLHEAGSPNFIGAMAMVRALEELKKIGFENIYNHERKIKDYLIEEMKKIDNVTIYGDTENTEDRLGVISFNIKNKDCYKVADIFAKESAVSLRAGKFCAHPYVARLLKVSNSYEEYEKNLDDADFGMVRLSIGLYNTMEEAKIFIDELKRIALDIY